jgi:hypothetical protein
LLSLSWLTAAIELLITTIAAVSTLRGRHFYNPVGLFPAATNWRKRRPQFFGFVITFHAHHQLLIAI